MNNQPLKRDKGGRDGDRLCRYGRAGCKRWNEVQDTLSISASDILLHDHLWSNGPTALFCQSAGRQITAAQTRLDPTGFSCPLIRRLRHLLVLFCARVSAQLWPNSSLWAWTLPSITHRWTTFAGGGGGKNNNKWLNFRDLWEGQNLGHLFFFFLFFCFFSILITPLVIQILMVAKQAQSLH